MSNDTARLYYNMFLDVKYNLHHNYANPSESKAELISLALVPYDDQTPIYYINTCFSGENTSLFVEKYILPNLPCIPRHVKWQPLKSKFRKALDKVKAYLLGEYVWKPIRSTHEEIIKTEGIPKYVSSFRLSEDLRRYLTYHSSQALSRGRQLRIVTYSGSYDWYLLTMLIGGCENIPDNVVKGHFDTQLLLHKKGYKDFNYFRKVLGLEVKPPSYNALEDAKQLKENYRLLANMNY